MTTPYRVWWNPQLGMCDSFYYEVSSLAEGALLVDVLAKYDMFQYENRVKGDYANAGGVQYWDNEENDWMDVDESEYSA